MIDASHVELPMVYYSLIVPMVSFLLYLKLQNFLLCFVVVMQSEGFKYLEESCRSLLSELLETVASVDEKSGPSGKRSGSSIIGLDVAPPEGAALAESVNPYLRRLRRRH